MKNRFTTIVALSCLVLAGCSPAAKETLIPAGWQTVSQSGVTFSYPELTTEYMHAQEWPPSVVIEDAPYSCDSENETRTINGAEYCVHEQNEGAAGSVYTDYLYIASRDGGARAAVLRFTIRATQCYNYDEPKQSACFAERAAFSADTLADGIMRTAR